MVFQLDSCTLEEEEELLSMLSPKSSWFPSAPFPILDGGPLTSASLAPNHFLFKLRNIFFNSAINGQSVQPTESDDESTWNGGWQNNCGSVTKTFVEESQRREMISFGYIDVLAQSPTQDTK